MYAAQKDGAAALISIPPNNKVQVIVTPIVRTNQIERRNRVAIVILRERRSSSL